MIRKAVIPAAGLGTRFFPATKAVPKEMLPIVDTPTIQFVVEEALQSGISDILIVSGPAKRAIEEHFGCSPALELSLLSKGKSEDLATLRNIVPAARIHFIWQREPRGLGDAILCARDYTGNEPFAVLLGDTIVESASEKPVTAQLSELYCRHKRPVIALEEVARGRISKYGIVSGREIEPGVVRIEGLVEKPLPSDAPSNLAVASRYILTPEVYSYLQDATPGKNNEIQLTDSLNAMARTAPLYGLRFHGTRYDIGNKTDYLKTSLHFALKRGDMKKEMADFIKKMAREIDD